MIPNPELQRHARAWPRSAPALLAAMLAVIAFWPVLGAGFVWDDIFLLGAGADFSSWSGFWATMFHGHMDVQAYFRPLALMSLGLEQSLALPGLVLPHAGNLALHALNAAMVAWVAVVLANARGLEPRRAAIAGLLAGAVFALHPAAIETVSWISCRFDLLCTFFCLVILVLDRSSLRSLPRAVLMGLAFLLAALSKEMAVALPLLLPVWHLQFMPANARLREWPRLYRERGHVLQYACIAAAGLAYLALRRLGMGEVYAQQGDMPAGLAAQILLPLKTLGAYLFITAWPFSNIAPLHVLHAAPALRDLQVLAALAALGLAAWLLLRRRELACLPVCMLIGLLPVLHILPLPASESYANERMLYLPLVFSSLFAVLTLCSAHVSSSARLALAATAAAWLLACLVLVRATIPHWHDNLAFWAWAFEREPQSGLVTSNLMTAMNGAGMHREVLELAAQVETQAGGLNLTQSQLLLGSRQALGMPVADDVEHVVAGLDAMPPRNAGEQRVRARHYAQLAWMLLKEGAAPQAQAVVAKALADNPAEPLARLGAVVLRAAQGTGIMSVEDDAQWQPLVGPALRESWRREAEQLLARLHEAP